MACTCSSTPAGWALKALCQNVRDRLIALAAALVEGEEPGLRCGEAGGRGGLGSVTPKWRRSPGSKNPSLATRPGLSTHCSGPVGLGGNPGRATALLTFRGAGSNDIAALSPLYTYRRAGAGEGRDRR